MNLKDQALNAIEVLNDDSRLEKYLKEVFPNNTLTQLWDALKANLLCETLQHRLVAICPLCLKINGKIFLKGNDSRQVDYVGDETLANVIELYDMTTEMKTGESYTFYVSSIDYFKVASAKDTVDVHLFLKSLK